MNVFSSCRGALFGVLLALGCSACGGGEDQKPVFPVSGQVFVKKQPAVGALVVFTPVRDADSKLWPKGYPRGTVQKDGSFRLTTYKTDDGAPVGEYAVTVVWGKPLPGKEEEVDHLAGRYADPKASRIRVQVKEDAEGTTVPAIRLD